MRTGEISTRRSSQRHHGTGLPRLYVSRPSQSDKQWSVERRTSLATFHATGQLYASIFSPHTPGLLATAGQDGTVRLWDARAAGAAGQPSPQMSFRGGPEDILAADWNKYHQGILATAGKDGTIRVWDVRNPLRPTVELPGHSLAVRKLQ